MQRRNGIFNEKRRIREDVTPEELTGLAREISYGGNPEHKRNPGDFGLTPPSQPRADKTLCDAIEVFSRKVATRLLKSGVLKGLISKNERNGFPRTFGPLPTMDALWKRSWKIRSWECTTDTQCRSRIPSEKGSSRRGIGNDQ